MLTRKNVKQAAAFWRNKDVRAGRKSREGNFSWFEKLAYVDILANSKIRFDSVKRMTQIQKTS